MRTADSLTVVDDLLKSFRLNREPAQSGLEAGHPIRPRDASTRNFYFKSMASSRYLHNPEGAWRYALQALLFMALPIIFIMENVAYSAGKDLPGIVNFR